MNLWFGICAVCFAKVERIKFLKGQVWYGLDFQASLNNVWDPAKGRFTLLNSQKSMRTPIQPQLYLGILIQKWPCKVQVILKFRSNLSFLCMVVYHAVECLEVLALKEVFSSFLSLLKPYWAWVARQIMHQILNFF